MMSPTHYEILGVLPTAIRPEIRRAWAQKANELHSDRTKGDDEELAIINAAYTVLGDEKTRREYDQTLSATDNFVPWPIQTRPQTGWKAHPFTSVQKVSGFQPFKPSPYSAA